jgi:hypothetical protein
MAFCPMDFTARLDLRAPVMRQFAPFPADLSGHERITARRTHVIRNRSTMAESGRTPGMPLARIELAHAV